MVKGFLDIEASLGTGFEKFDAEFFSKTTAFFFGYLSIFKINLIPDQYLDDSIRGMQLDLFNPILNIFEGFSLVYSIG